MKIGLNERRSLNMLWKTICLKWCMWDMEEESFGDRDDGRLFENRGKVSEIGERK